MSTELRARETEGTEPATLIMVVVKANGWRSREKC